MENNPEAPTSAPAEASVASPVSTNSESQAPAQPVVDLGLTPEQAEKFKTFISNSGGFDNAFSKLKSDISTPKSMQPQPESQPVQAQPQAPVQPAQSQYTPPQGSITAQEFLAQQYFQSLSHDPKYEAISEQIASGEVLKEMAAFNISALNQDGSLNDTMVRRYLDLKAQTVPAKPTGTEPNASTAPTVEYVPVEGDKIGNIDQAYAILQQDAQLKSQGLGGHPSIALAEDFIKNAYTKK